MARMRLTVEAVNALQAHHWPGNVRELENTIARACALASSNILLPGDIPLASTPGKAVADHAAAIDQLLNVAPAGENLLGWVTREVAGRVVERADGDIKEASILLEMPLSDLRKILSR